MKRSPIPLALVLLVGLAPMPSFGTDTHLKVETRLQGLAFQIAGEKGDGPWLLQKSTDMIGWDDLAFLKETEATEIEWNGLPDSVPQLGFFRAIQVAEEDPGRLRFMEQILEWRRADLNSYEYELRQNFGLVSWHGKVTVVDGVVTDTEVIELIPPFFEIDPPTVDGLFDRIGRALEQDAATVDINWDASYGYPQSGFIDISELIADEEQSWSIESFTPLPDSVDP